ncbi:Uncharacterized protein Fot_04682 [Forsythia ovata]|uniref:Uncharacterized protein n=1 Tax=Forsythia ovata TaxID=205694 RepID=A0ABD1XGC2_9LAMI
MTKEINKRKIGQVGRDGHMVQTYIYTQEQDRLTTSSLTWLIPVVLPFLLLSAPGDGSNPSRFHKIVQETPADIIMEERTYSLLSNYCIIKSVSTSSVQIQNPNPINIIQVLCEILHNLHVRHGKGKS